jgi:glutathione S-transferase
MRIVLHQFAASHFNEKARWALDLKASSYERKTYLPGPHMLGIRRRSGQTQTPVLEIDGEFISGSAAIIDRLEALFPDPRVYPTDPSQRERALELQREFDRDLGPAVRTVLFSVLIHEGAFLCRTFSQGKSGIASALYRASYPLARPLIAKGNGVVDPANVTRAFEITAKTLDRVASLTGATGYLIGDAFSVADLTAAALFAPLAEISHPDMARPRPVPPRISEFLRSYSSHPAIRWVETIYARHRTKARA